MPFGILDTQYIDFPQGVDVAYLQGLKNRAGVDFNRLLTEIDARIAAYNASVDGLVAELVTQTTEAYIDSVNSASFVVNESSEYTLPRPQITDGNAMMLPLRKYDVATGFTEEGLENMSMTRILGNIDGMLNGLKRNQRLAVLRRLFSVAEVRVDPKTTALSAGFAGSGTGYNVFSSNYPDGSSLPGGYTHYFRDTTANIDVVGKTALTTLKKWNNGPFDLIAPQAVIDLIAASPNFVSAGSALVRQGGNVAEAQLDPNMYVGAWFGEIRVKKAITETSDTYFAIYKSFGNFAPNNPLAWRYDDAVGKGAYMRYRSLYPLDQAVVLQRFGVGVNNRVAAALVRLAGSGSYIDPTFA